MPQVQVLSPRPQLFPSDTGQCRSSALSRFRRELCFSWDIQSVNIPFSFGYNTFADILHIAEDIYPHDIMQTDKDKKISENLLTTMRRKCIIKKLSDGSRDTKSNDFEKNQKNLKKALDKRQNM